MSTLEKLATYLRQIERRAAGCASHEVEEAIEDIRREARLGLAIIEAETKGKKK